MMRVLVLWLGIVLLFSGCWSSVEFNRYDAYVVNQTSFPFYLLVDQTRDTTNGFVIEPNESYYFTGQPDVSDDDDPVVSFHSNLYAYEQTVEIMRGDSVLVTWEGPGRYMGESVNHFYNYDSWKVSFERDEAGLGYYTLEFFVQEEDLP